MIRPCQIRSRRRRHWFADPDDDVTVIVEPCTVHDQTLGETVPALATDGTPPKVRKPVPLVDRGVVLVRKETADAHTVRSKCHQGEDIRIPAARALHCVQAHGLIFRVCAVSPFVQASAEEAEQYLIDRVSNRGLME